MERVTNDNFEQFLQENAEQLRMHPSDKVWEGISQNINKTRRRSLFFGLASLLTITSSLGYLILNAPSPNIFKRSIADKYSASSSKSTLQKPAPTNGPSKVENRPLASVTEQETVPQKAKVIPIDKIQKEESIKIGADKPNAAPDWAPGLLSADKPSGLLKNLYNRQELQLNSNENTQPIAETTPSSNKDIRHKRKSSKFDMMFFFTPTVSYRKLSENKSYLRSSPVGAPYSYAALYDVNNAVTHKPDIGLEFGMTGRYAITKNIKLRAGVQFNISRYDIKAFKYVPEVATIALNSRGYGVDSLNTISSYRNFNGGKSDWLQNFYFQVSAPMGAEIKLHGNEKMHIGIASTIQPTYVIGNRSYLITSDYKNYAQVPWLIRRWNVNTNLETFVAYSTGKLKWQVGPQMRYQLLSSFISEYPVKENLFDFGLKVGISLNQNR